MKNKHINAFESLIFEKSEEDKTRRKVAIMWLANFFGLYKDYMESNFEADLNYSSDYMTLKDKTFCGENSSSFSHRFFSGIAKTLNVFE